MFPVPFVMLVDVLQKFSSKAWAPAAVAVRAAPATPTGPIWNDTVTYCKFKRKSVCNVIMR